MHSAHSLCDTNYMVARNSVHVSKQEIYVEDKAHLYY